MEYIDSYIEYNEAFGFDKVRSYLLTIKKKLSPSISLKDLKQFYQIHKEKFDFVWKNIIAKLPDNMGAKKGIKLAMSDNHDDAEKAAIVLGLILTNNIKKKQLIDGQTEEEILNDFKEFLKIKN